VGDEELTRVAVAAEDTGLDTVRAPRPRYKFISNVVVLYSNEDPIAATLGSVP
jgi:hypothetical protein